MDPKIVLNTAFGVAEDCQRLVDKFVARNSYRFSVFASCWRESMFSHILTGRTRWPEVVEFLESLFAVCVGLMTGSPSDRESELQWLQRTGAVYLSYGLYNKLPLPTRKKVWLRVTPADWSRIEALLRHFSRQCHHDAHYALTYLFQQGAFLFVATTWQMAPGLKRGKCDASSTTGAAGAQTAAQAAQLDSCDELRASLVQLSALHGRYVGMKTALLKGDSESQLGSVCADPTPNICSLLNLKPITTPSTDPLSASSSSSAAPAAAVASSSTTAGHSGPKASQTVEDSKSDAEDLGAARRRVRDKAVARFRPDRQ